MSPMIARLRNTWRAFVRDMTPPLHLRRWGKTRGGTLTTASQELGAVFNPDKGTLLVYGELSSMNVWNGEITRAEFKEQMTHADLLKIARDEDVT